MDVETLSRQNPWWIRREAIEDDNDIRKWKEGKIRWIPQLLERIVLKPFSLNFVFGPRQVGKTTLLKLLIRKLLQSGIDARRIFYFRCDKLENFKELDEVIKTYLEFREGVGINSSFFLLDEITFPREWFRTIKYYIDVGEFKRDVLILTGSLSMYLKREVELFPGRRGFGRNYTMLPLSFREFLEVLDPEIQGLPRLEHLKKEEIFEKAYKTLPYFERLNKLFKKYLALGGFPLCVKNEAISEETKETYWAWIRTDLAKIGRSEETFRKVAKAILEKSPSPISLNSIAKEFEIGTHKTVYEYVNVMEKMFVAKVLYWLDPNRVVSNYKKNRKIVFTDPFFFHLFSDICLSKLPEESKIVENIVASHLARRFEVFYWKDGRELDVIAKSKDSIMGFEVKWREKVKEDYSRTVLGKIKDVVCLTKDEMREDKNLLPIPIFLSLI